jgi:uncharacterized DUF497 family protein
MSQIRFEWHPRKAKANLQKHGVSFVVVHALRDRDVIRIISARKATRLETREYEIRLR